MDNEDYSRYQKIELFLLISRNDLSFLKFIRAFIQGCSWLGRNFSIGVSVDGFAHSKDEFGIHDMFDPLNRFHESAEGSMRRHPSIFANRQGGQKVCMTLICFYESEIKQDKDVYLVMPSLYELCIASLKENVKSQNALESFVSAHHFNHVDAAKAEWIQLSGTDPARFYKCLKHNLLRDNLSFDSSQLDVEPDEEEIFIHRLRSHYES